MRTAKSVFAPNEPVTIEFSAEKGYGFDRVVVRKKSSCDSVNQQFESQVSQNGVNDFIERKNSITFPPLPEGEYEAHYLSWDFGNYPTIASYGFSVGRTSSPSTPPPATSTPPPAQFKDLSGLWKNPGGNGIYRVRQVGNKFVWGIDAVAQGSYANVYQGQISGDVIDGVWDDLPGSPTIGGGRMLLKIESDCRITKISSVNFYAATVWIKTDGLCDRVGLTQTTASTASAANVAGTWQFVCCSGKYKGNFTLSQQGSKLSGYFGNTTNGTEGTISGEVSGASVTFRRQWPSGTQTYTMTLSADGKSLSGTLAGTRDTTVGTDITATRP